MEFDLSVCVRGLLIQLHSYKKISGGQEDGVIGQNFISWRSVIERPRNENVPDEIKKKKKRKQLFVHYNEVLPRNESLREAYSFS